MKAFITVDKAVFRSFPLPKQNRLIELAIDLRQDDAANLLRWWQQTDKRTEPAHFTPASTGMENVESPITIDAAMGGDYDVIGKILKFLRVEDSSGLRRALLQEIRS